MRNAALFSLLAIVVVSLTAPSYAEDWGPGPQGPLGYGSRDGIRQGGPNRGEDPNAIPGVAVTPPIGFPPNWPPPDSVPPKYGKRYGKRRPPGYPPRLPPPPQQQYPPYYPPPQQ